MGYDCTLHAVHEKDVSETFVDALLAGKPPGKGSPAQRGIDQSLWHQTFKTLAEATPEAAASTVCQLALIFASKKWPYHYERGFALSLWPDQPDGLHAEIPAEFTDSPEKLFKKLRRKYPELKGRFPEDFSGNWSTGKFIPAKNVAKALRWVQKRVEEFEEGQRRLFRGLILVLEHCARNKLAYWEATDLPIPMATVSLEGSDARRARRSFRWPDHGYEPLARKASLFVCKCSWGPSKNSRTAFADFSTWPPKLDSIREHTISASLSKSGRVVCASSEPESCSYDVMLRDNPASVPRPLKAADNVRVGERGFEWVDFFGEQVVSLVWFKKGKTAKRYPLFHDGDQLVEDRSFRPTKDNHKDHWGGENIKVTVAQTGSGDDVFVWDDAGYERVKGKFGKTFPLASGVMWSDERFTVAAGVDGFFYTANRCLFEARRSSPSTAHLPELTNIMTIGPGPEASLLLKEGNNKSGDWGKLYWPEARQIARLKPNLLPDIAPDDLRSMHWLEESGRLLFFTGKEVWFIPWDELRSIPRANI